MCLWAGTCRWAARVRLRSNGENDNFLPFLVQFGEMECSAHDHLHAGPRRRLPNLILPSSCLTPKPPLEETQVFWEWLDSPFKIHLCLTLSAPPLLSFCSLLGPFLTHFPACWSFIFPSPSWFGLAGKCYGGSLLVSVLNRFLFSLPPFKGC